jgi:hypothetical protein
MTAALRSVPVKSLQRCLTGANGGNREGSQNLMPVHSVISCSNKFNLTASLAPTLFPSVNAAESLQEFHQSIGCFFRSFFGNPVPGVLEHDDRDVGCDQLHLRSEFVA